MSSLFTRIVPPLTVPTKLCSYCLNRLMISYLHLYGQPLNYLWSCYMQMIWCWFPIAKLSWSRNWISGRMAWRGRAWKLISAKPKLWLEESNYVAESSSRWPCARVLDAIQCSVPVLNVRNGFIRKGSLHKVSGSCLWQICTPSYGMWDQEWLSAMALV